MNDVYEGFPNVRQMSLRARVEDVYLLVDDDNLDRLRSCVYANPIAHMLLHVRTAFVVCSYDARWQSFFHRSMRLKLSAAL